MTTVLVVDDLPVFIELHEDLLQGSGLSVVTATTLDELDARYLEHLSDLAGIILDGCVPGNELNTVPFIHRVVNDRREGLFTGFLIAASSDSDYRKEMVRQGCTHEARKDEAVTLLRALLAR
jgi:CheY-like chemotaxis protein